MIFSSQEMTLTSDTDIYFLFVDKSVIDTIFHRRDKVVVPDSYRLKPIKNPVTFWNWVCFAFVRKPDTVVSPAVQAPTSAARKPGNPF